MLGVRLLDGLQRALGSHPDVVAIRGQGLIAGIELNRPCTELVGRALAEQRLLITVTHGNPSSFSGRHYRIVPYGLDLETGLIDYDEMERIALETRPRMLIGDFSAHSLYKD